MLTPWVSIYSHFIIVMWAAVNYFQKERPFSRSPETNLLFLTHILWCHPPQESRSVSSAGVFRWRGVVRGVDRHRLSVRLSAPSGAPGQHTSPLRLCTHYHAARCGEETVVFVQTRNIIWSHTLHTEFATAPTQPRVHNENKLRCRKEIVWGETGQISKTDVLKASWELLWERQLRTMWLPSVGLCPQYLFFQLETSNSERTHVCL